MSRRGPYWKNETTWICPNHLPSVKIPANVECCFYVNCTSKRPERLSSEDCKHLWLPRPRHPVDRHEHLLRPLEQPPVRPKKPVALLPHRQHLPQHLRPQQMSQFTMPWARSFVHGLKCDKGENGGRAVTRSRSKYCSRDCSNRNARWRHKIANWLQRSSSSGKSSLISDWQLRKQI